MGFLSRICVDPKTAFRIWSKFRRNDPLLDIGRTTATNERYSKADRERLRAVVDWTCLNVIIFKAVLLNYVYTTFLHDFTITMTQRMI